MDAPPGFFVKAGEVSKPGINETDVADDDLPEGFHLKSTGDQLLADFLGSCDWFYKDPSGLEHGPVAASKIIRWFEKGHFNDYVSVRCSSPWLQMGHVLPKLQPAGHEGRTPAAGLKPVAAKPNRVRPAAAAVIAVTPKGAAARRETPPHAVPARATPGAAAPALSSAPSEAEAAMRLFTADMPLSQQPLWRYVDNQGQIQGPFTSEQMDAWFKHNMLPTSTPCCGSSPSDGAEVFPQHTLFRPLGDLLKSVQRGQAYVPVRLDCEPKGTPFAEMPGTPSNNSGVNEDAHGGAAWPTNNDTW